MGYRWIMVVVALIGSVASGVAAAREFEDCAIFTPTGQLLSPSLGCDPDWITGVFTGIATLALLLMLGEAVLLLRRIAKE